MGQYGDSGEDISINMDRFSENFRVNMDPKIQRKEVHSYDMSKPESPYSHCDVAKLVFLSASICAY